MNAVTQWMGHGKSRRRCELRRTKKTDDPQSLEDSNGVNIYTEPSFPKTWRGILSKINQKTGEVLFGY